MHTLVTRIHTSYREETDDEREYRLKHCPDSLPFSHPFFKAVAQNDLDTVKQRLADGWDPNHVYARTG